MSETPLLTAGSTARTLWQTYRIYGDRLEFDTIFGRWTIPFADVERAEVAEPLVTALLHLRLDLVLRGIKLDFADFQQHVELDVENRLLRRIVFTPDDPEAFVRVLDEALAAWRRGRPLRSDRPPGGR